MDAFVDHVPDMTKNWPTVTCNIKHFIVKKGR